jgi:hypothetical protein
MTVPPIFQPTLENREQLSQLLQNPVLIAAIRQVTDDVRVPSQVLKTQVAELVTRRSAFHEGRASILDDLAALTLPKRTPSPMPHPWDHVEAEHTQL